MHLMKRATLAFSAFALFSIMLIPLSAGAGQREGVDYIDPARPHCVTTAYSAEWINAGKDARMTDAECFATYEEAQSAAPSVRASREADSEQSGDSVTTQSFTYQAIAVHCDGACVTGGPTLTINGTDCAGGGLVFSSTWDDRIDENRHKRCGEIALYALENYTGGCSTFGGYNEDRTPCRSLVNSNESAKYFGPVN